MDPMLVGVFGGSLILIACIVGVLWAFAARADQQALRMVDQHAPVRRSALKLVQARERQARVRPRGQ